MKVMLRGALVGLVAAGCATSNVRRFPPEAPLTELDDRRPYAKPPESFYSPFIWDGANYSSFRPLARFWTFPVKSDALDVNALDEVPNSSWFMNRMSARVLSPEEVHRGACPDANDEPKLPWVVVGGKPDGSNPGFQVKDGSGVRQLVKVDGTLQPERATASDVIGAAMFHAAGYWVPCNRVVFIRKDQMRLKEGAEVKRTNGTVEPLTQETIDQIMSKATEVSPGLFRVSVSEFIPGRPIGPWRYEGVRKDDPNDTIPHEHRRSNRGMRLLAAWFDHVDTRQENTMLAWMQVGDGELGYTRHYRIDFGDGFGIIQGPDGIPQRLGHAGYFDLGQMSSDFVTFGLQNRPWFDKEMGKAGVRLGYYRAEPFSYDPWQPGYPNPAFDEATESDYAWMARILARFTPSHIKALVERGRVRDPVMKSEMIRIMTVRRRKMLERYLTRLSPLTWPDLRGSELCLQDVAVWSKIRDIATRKYAARAYVEGRRRPRSLEIRKEDDAYVCARLPEVETDGQRYLVVDVEAGSAGRDAPGPARIHLYGAGNGSFMLVGLERPAAGGEEPRL